MLQIVPDREAVGEDGWTGTLLDVPTLIMAKLVWDRLLLPAGPLLAMARGPPLLEDRDRIPKDPKIVREALQTKRIPVCCNVSDVKVEATWLWSVPPQPSH